MFEEIIQKLKAEMKDYETELNVKLPKEIQKARRGPLEGSTLDGGLRQHGVAPPFEFVDTNCDTGGVRDRKFR